MKSTINSVKVSDVAKISVFPMEDGTPHVVTIQFDMIDGSWFNINYINREQAWEFIKKQKFYGKIISWFGKEYVSTSTTSKTQPVNLISV